MDTYSYIYDTRGNMSEMPHLDNMKWNISNELYKTENGTMEAYYQYSGGQRIRKWVDKGSIKEERIYLGSFEIYRKFESSSLKVERQTVHVSDDSGRIAMLEKRTFGLAADDNNTAATLVRYIYSNHLQSASLELDDNADIISYEEYHPYGTTSYQAINAAINAVAKRYRYTGKERDEESGLYYHGARYYIPWLCRWSAVDPSENKNTPKSSYGYCSNNPISKRDPDGKDEIYFNYLYVKKSLIKTDDFNKYGVDSFNPLNFGIPTTEYQVYTWMSVVKNDKPNTYHINKFSFDVNSEGSSEGPQKYFSLSISDSDAQQANPNSNYVRKEIKELYQTISDFSFSLTSNYGSSQLSSLNGSKNQKEKNINSIHNLLRNSELYKENVREQELENEMFLFAITLVASELLVLKLAKGGSWVGRLGNETIEEASKGVTDAFTLTKHGELTNGVYTVSKEAMKKHVFNTGQGRSVFYPTLNADEAVLKAAQYADEAGLWIYNAGTKAKVPVLNTNIGTTGLGQPTNIINIYRKPNGMIHGAPGN